MKRLLAVLTLAFSAPSCRDNLVEPPPPPPEPEVLSVAVSPDPATLDIADALRFKESVETANGASKAVTWSVEPPELGTISADGLFSPSRIGEGRVKVTSIADPAKFATATVTVVKMEVLAFHRYGDDSTKARCGGVWCQEIYLQRLDGTGLRRVTITPWVQDLSPSWFPDGRRLAFTRANPLPIQVMTVCIVDTWNSGTTRCFDLGPLTNGSGPSVSPDGKKIALAYFDQDVVPGPVVATGIAVVDADGKNLTRLTRTVCNGGFCTADGGPTWSPDGKWILFNRPDGNIWRMRPDGSELTKLIEKAFHAVYSPDGERIAFTSKRTGKVQIFVMNADGTGLQQFTPEDDNYSAPAWSPDGTRITFSSQGHITDNTFDKDGEIWVMKADSTGPMVNVTKSPKNSETQPAWRP